MIEINWQILTQILIAIIALAGFSLSLYLVFREKPSLSIEKITAGKKGDTFIDFRFYLDNTGEKPTTIKSIEFHTDENFMPKNRIVVLSEETIPGISGGIVIHEKVKGFALPYHILPNTSLKLKARLDFSHKHERTKIIKPNDGEGQIHFNIIIKHSKGTFKDRI